MNKTLFSAISKEYEKRYNFFISKGFSSVETIKLLNDAILIPFIIEKNELVGYIEESNNLLFEIIDKNYLFSNSDLLKEAGNNFFECLDFFASFIYGTEDSNNLIKNILGSVLEKHINRKETGSYYTPEDTTKYISWNAIFISILNKLDQNLILKIKKIYEIEDIIDLLNIKKTIEEKIDLLKRSLNNDDISKIINITKRHKVVDPTCGSGAFIISAYQFFEYLNSNLFSSVLKSTDIFGCLYGVDMSEEAVLLTKIRCIMHFYNRKTTTIDWFFKKFDKQFIVADALSGPDYVLRSGDGFDWKQFKKFDCVIGNPPYVEQKSNITNRYFSKKCGNLYAYVIERSCNILRDKGMLAFIVPLPLIATPRMSDIRKYLHSKSSKIYYSSFADRPGCLFSGVHQRLTIFFAQIGDASNVSIYTSKYHYWYNGERKQLFNNINYVNNVYPNLPKIGNSIDVSILEKISNCNHSLSDYFIKKSNFSIWISTRIGFWTKAFMTKIGTNELKQYFVEDNISQKIIYCLLNSSIFYYYWILNSDCWHVTNNDINRFKFDMSLLNKEQKKQLVSLASRLDEDLEKNKVKINSKQTLYEYKHKFSKYIIDMIDDILSCVYNLTVEEVEYIKNFTLKYRLNTYHKEG